MVREGYKQTEIGVIPEDWELKAIGDVGSVSSGGTPSRTNLSYWNGTIPWITTTQIDFNTIDSAEQFITKNGLNNSAAKLFSPGTLLMAMYGQGKTRGKVAVLGVKASTNQACAAILLGENVNQKYVFHYLVSQYEVIRTLSNIGNQENLNGLIIKSIKIPFPPLEEQRSIAQALSDVDALIASLDKLITKKRHFKTATMQQLLTGKKRLPGFGEGQGYKQTEVGVIPEDWNVCSLKEICSAIVDGTHYTPSYFADGIPFYSVENVTTDDFQYIKFISNEEHLRLIKRCKPEKGDILITRIGSLGVTKLIDWEVNASIYVSLALLKLSDKIHSGYVYAYSKSQQFVKDVEKRSLVNATPQKINMEDIGKVPISIPEDAEEQRAIATVLSDMDTEITALETRLAKTQTIKQGMMQELLTGRTRLV